MAEAAYGQVAQSDPLFAPHASLAFEMLDTLGQGGMGTVYKVRDRRGGRLAALKVLIDAHAHEQSQQRFLSEASLTAKLDHPGIPPVYEVGRTASGQLFLVMRLIQGRTLDDEIQDFHESNPGDLPLDLIKVLVKVCEALAYAHSQGIVHRDLKPENIMVGQFGEVLLMDWGIAKDLNSKEPERLISDALPKTVLAKAGLTVAGSVIGTPGYMAPEQANGEAVDTRADVYAMGLILAEILTGSAATPGESAINRIMANATGKYIDPEDLDISCPRSLLWILRQSLLDDRNERTQSIQTFSEQLNGFLTDRSIPGYSPSLLERSAQFSRRHPATVLGAFLGGLLVLLVTGLLFAIREGQRSQREAEMAKDKASQSKRLADTAQEILEGFNEARELARKGEKVKTQATLEGALTKAQRSRVALLTAANLCKTAKMLDLAKLYFNEVIDAHPPSYDALFELHLIESQGDDSKVTASLLRLLDRAKARSEVNEFTHFNEGNRLYDKGDFEGAVAAYTRSIDCNSNLSPVYLNRAIAYDRLKQTELVIADLKRVLELNPRQYKAYVNLSKYRFRQGRDDEAFDLINRAISIEPAFPESYRQRAMIYFKVKRYQAALADLNTGLDLNPQDPADYTLHRAVIYEVLKQTQKALENYSLTLDRDPNRLKALLNRGVIHSRGGRYEDARRDFDRAARVAPKDPRPYFNRGVLREHLKNTDGALTDFTTALQYNKEMISALLRRSQVYVRLRQVQQAMADLDRALTLEPKNAEVYRQKGALLRFMGRFDESLKFLNKALKLNPQLTNAYLNRAWTFQSLKRYGLAIRDINDYLSRVKNPTQVQSARKLRAQLVAQRGR